MSVEEKATKLTTAKAKIYAVQRVPSRGVEVEAQERARKVIQVTMMAPTKSFQVRQLAAPSTEIMEGMGVEHLKSKMVAPALEAGRMRVVRKASQPALALLLEWSRARLGAEP